MIELDSPTDESVYSEENTVLTQPSKTEDSDKGKQSSQILPLAIEQVKLDKLTEASTVISHDLLGIVIFSGSKIRRYC